MNELEHRTAILNALVAAGVLKHNHVTYYGTYEASYTLHTLVDRLDRLMNYLGLEEKVIPPVPSVPAKIVLVKKKKKD